jgi:Asp-tRNA(Asn)/Glu-tRNA(Gln) amidotransferase C subunit
MELSNDDIRNLAKTAALEIPEADLNTIAIRLSSLLTLMSQIEQELGDEMDKIDPVPPVYPREPF